MAVAKRKAKRKRVKKVSKKSSKKTSKSAKRPSAKQSAKSSGKKPVQKKAAAVKSGKVLEKYNFKSMNIPIEITVKKVPGEYVPVYDVNISQISETTMVVL